MSKAYKISLALLVLLLVFLTWLEANEPQEINWIPSYAALDKIPLGTKVLFENLKQQDLDLQEVNIPPYEFLNDSTISGTYFFLNNSLGFDEPELKRILTWVARGNTAFFIAENFSQNLLDTLNLKMETLVPKKGISSKPFLNLKDPALENNRPFLFDKETYQDVFIIPDSLPKDVLGVTQLQQDSAKITAPKINFLRDTVGKGMVYLHSTPKAFSNYFLLQDNNATYAEKVFAYLPTQQPVFWDHYYKTGKSFYTSPLFVILNSKPLRWAYYFVIIGSLLFIIFEGKRKQRSIPVIKPLQNQTLDFTRTIAGLYLDRADYKSIASKKIALFLEYVRSQYRVATNEVNQGFYDRVAAMSENNTKEVERLWQFMERLEKKNSVSKEELLELNKAISAFKKK
ncbi:DUF4350 domain-containing protein [Salinimicrobium sp. MT39]|uniref:DUF4350 domain-containing protein n=1 Tax=Salinimicrobium profundisediminis TaxID=2994553 RepID=A0A9X3CZ31_9FLAO|nr:DUF4350 domain-containing protein [Salinimicrobium profundisediminis]MCX2839320.1 DUF4350 domain-containing protein [Salinimicrobium profundisediminis]